MDIRSKRWNDPRSPADGYRVLVTRYRPRALTKGKETWDEWQPDAGPSRELLADFKGKNGPPIGWEEYKQRYLFELQKRERVMFHLRVLARRGTLTLLCSSACEDPSRCHRTVLKALLEKR